MLNSYLFIYFHLIQKSVEQIGQTEFFTHWFTPQIHTTQNQTLLQEMRSPSKCSKWHSQVPNYHLELSSTASMVHILWKLESEAESGLHFSHSNMMFTVPNASSSTVLLCNPINFILLKKTDIYAKL